MSEAVKGLDPKLQRAFLKGGRANPIFEKKLNENISSTFTGLTCLGKTALLIVRDGKL